MDVTSISDNDSFIVPFFQSFHTWTLSNDKTIKEFCIIFCIRVRIFWGVCNVTSMLLSVAFLALFTHTHKVCRLHFLEAISPTRESWLARQSNFLISIFLLSLVYKILIDWDMFIMFGNVQLTLSGAGVRRLNSRWGGGTFFYLFLFFNLMHI